MKISKALFSFIGLMGVIVLIALSCGGGGGGGDSGGGSGTGSGSIPGTAFDAGTVKAQGTIGSNGGVVEVKDSTSPVNGTKITFSKDSLAAPETIQILHHSQYPALPSGVTANGPAISLTRTGTELFNNGVLVELPITKKDLTQADEYLDVLTYDEKYKEWVSAQSWYAYEVGKMVMLPIHFSKFISVIRKYKRTGDIWTTFNMDIDTMQFQNTGAQDCPQYSNGVCAGMANFTQWFFENQGHGLQCYYNWRTSERVSCDAYADRQSFWPVVSGFGEVFFSLDHTSTAVSWRKSLERNQVQSIAMLRIGGGHAAVVFAWISTSDQSDKDGYFLAYNVNDNAQPIKIYAKTVYYTMSGQPVITLTVENQPEYMIFGAQFNWAQQVSDVPGIFAAYPTDNACATDPTAAGTWQWKYQWQGQQEGQDTLRLRISGVWENQDIEYANGKWAVQGKQLTVRFEDPTFVYHNTWTGVLNATNDSVQGTMIQYRASDLQQTATGTFKGTRILK